MELEIMKKICKQLLGCDPEKITLQTRFEDDLDADSLTIFRILIEMESCFSCILDPNQAESVKTVQDALELIK